jgi:hypothetical protein
MTHLAMTVLVWMVRLQDPNDPALAHIMTPEWAASYLTTAQEIADAAERDPIAKDARLTASTLTYFAYQESRFDPNPCERDVRYDCDGGASQGLWQTWRGWGDPVAQTALRVMHKSFEVCSKYPFADRLSWYAVGSKGGCDSERGRMISRSRMLAAKRLAAVLPPSGER